MTISISTSPATAVPTASANRWPAGPRRPRRDPVPHIDDVGRANDTVYQRDAGYQAFAESGRLESSGQSSSGRPDYFDFPCTQDALWLLRPRESDANRWRSHDESQQIRQPGTLRGFARSARMIGERKASFAPVWCVHVISPRIRLATAEARESEAVSLGDSLDEPTTSRCDGQCRPMRPSCAQALEQIAKTEFLSASFQGERSTANGNLPS